jgi:hypothetical protein
MRLLKLILVFPIMIIIFFHSLYVTYMIVKNTDLVDLAQIESEEELNKHIQPHSVMFYERNKIWLHLINIACWIIFIKIIL